MEAVYRAYLTCLNERRFDDLGDFVHDVITYNGTPMTLDGYRALLTGDVVTIPDLVFTADLLVVQGDRVAARLWFDCSPRGEFRGLAADGRRVAFAEHAFYRFVEGRIAEVLSVIDVESVRAQLA